MVNEISDSSIVVPQVVRDEALELPPVVTGHESPAVRQKLESFYMSVAQMFDAWVKRSENYHTQRCYRRDVLSFIEFLGIDWPKNSWKLLKTSVEDVRRWRSFMSAET